MMDISKGRYWDRPWSLVDGCTPCSPGCDHCWSAAMASRFHSGTALDHDGDRALLVKGGKFTGDIVTHPDRLSIPLKRRKPTVYAVWNDLFHEEVPHEFIFDTLSAIALAPRHTFLVLTKRNQMDFYSMCGTDKEWWIHALSKNADILFGEEAACHAANAIIGCLSEGHNVGWPMSNLWHGLTVCNQQEADRKHEFLAVPGNLFLSVEPMLSSVDLTHYLRCPLCGYSRQDQLIHGDHHLCKGGKIPEVRCVILGGESGPGARPMHPDWVRSVRDQCAAAGVPFFFKQWGEWVTMEDKNGGPCMASLMNDGRYLVTWRNGETATAEADTRTSMLYRVGRKKAGRLLDGRTHDELPWLK